MVLYTLRYVDAGCKAKLGIMYQTSCTDCVVSCVVLYTHAHPGDTKIQLDRYTKQDTRQRERKRDMILEFNKGN